MGLVNTIFDWLFSTWKSNNAGGVIFLPFGLASQSKFAGNMAQTIASVYASVHAYADAISSMDLAVCRRDTEDFEPYGRDSYENNYERETHQLLAEELESDRESYALSEEEGWFYKD